MNILPNFIQQKIFDFLFIGDQLIYKLCDKNNKFLKIKYVIKSRILSKIDDFFIKKHYNIKKLNASWNSKITNVSCITNLKILDASGYCGISDYGLFGINLKKLYASDNSKIINVSHMTNLKILYVYDNCGIDNEGLIGLNLQELYACGNSKITNISYMTNLKILHASGDCGINDNGIIGLNLKELYAQYNFKIKKL